MATIESSESNGLATIIQASQYLKVGKSKIYELIKDDELKVIYIGAASPRIEWTTIYEFVDRMKKQKLKLKRKQKRKLKQNPVGEAGN